MLTTLRRAGVAIATACAIATTLLPAAPAKAALLPAIEVNGQLLADDLTRIENNRLLIGLRSAAEALGAAVEWDGGERRVTMRRGTAETVLWIDSPIARVNGRAYVLDVAPRILNNQTIVPYRFVGESLGAHVGWDDTNRVAWLWSSLTPYTVQLGDSLSSIARQFQMTVDQVRRVNQLPTDALALGQVVQVRADLAPLSPVAVHPFRTISGYTVVTGWNDTRSLESVRANGNRLTDIATVSHRLRADGSLGGSPQPLTLASAKEQGLRSWLVVQNLDDTGSFSRPMADAFLRDAAARRRFAQESLQVLKANGFVGLEVDIEDVSPASRPYFSLLMKELKAALSAQGFQLAAAIPAKTSDSPSNNWSGAYDYAEIGKYADRVLLMTYDENWFGGPSGPIASLPWVERVLRYSTTVIPPEKTLLGIAGYAYDWRLSGGRARILSAREAERLAGIHGAQWDAASSSPFIRYKDAAGAERIIWYENERSMRLKFETARSFGLQGIGIWRLGVEDLAFWRSLNP